MGFCSLVQRKKMAMMKDTLCQKHPKEGLHIGDQHNDEKTSQPPESRVQSPRHRIAGWKTETA
jgi:hypothetical protein